VQTFDLFFINKTVCFMSLELLLGAMGSSLLLVSGMMVIRSTNPVHSVLCLILAFANAAGILVGVSLDFFAMVFLVVYVGAIAVLFLFVVMMLNIKLEEMTENGLRYLPVGGLLGLIFLVEMFLVVEHEFIPALTLSSAELAAWEPLAWTPWVTSYQTVSNLEAIGPVLYTYFYAYFLLASLILLVAMIGAIVLTMSKGVGVKRQNSTIQNCRDFTKTVKAYRPAV
jgi:NADH:ubiquinone oxidoreductase subunit 6 (subunit J)